MSIKLLRKKMSTRRSKKPMSTRRSKKPTSTKRAKKPMSTKRSERSLTDLPSDVLVEILARLPLRTLFVARSVCKTFSLLTTSNPHFINLHSSNASQILVFHLGEFETFRIPSYLLRLADQEHDYKKSQLKPLFQLPNVGLHLHRPFFTQVPHFFITNSCNGLVCFGRNGRAGFCSSVVCNPVTNEYILIPEFEPRIKSPSSVIKLTKSIWLGFSDQYKVLRIFCRMDTHSHRHEVSAQVYLIGSDTCRYIDGPPLRRSHFYSDLCHALVNGVMYWHYWSWSDLFSFDFHKEKFSGVALPPEFKEADRTSIGVLGGCLCLTCNHFDGHRIDLWVMTKCGSWIKEFVVDTGEPVYDHFRPLQLLQNGKILMQCLRKYLVCYDPRSKTLIYYELHKKLDYMAVALTPSFVPLKDTLKVDKVLSELRPRGDEKD